MDNCVHYQKFEQKAKDSIEALFDAAKKKDEFAYIFSLLGFNSGMEDRGWQPIAETFMLMRDFVGIANAPFSTHTKVRLLLLCYTQLTEASYIYHVIYNMLVSIADENPPVLFSFLDLYQRGTPPSVKSKVKLICNKARVLNFPRVKELLEDTFDSEIRNAVSHADYILFQNELRLKHKGSEIRKINLEDVFSLVQKTIILYEVFFLVSDVHRKSYKDGYVIENRVGKNGNPLAKIILTFDKDGVLNGFKQSDPLPTW